MARILVVEDDDDLRFLYEALLKREGYAVTVASGTTGALVQLTNNDFDLIVLDMNLPDAPGIKIIEFASDDRRLRDIPMIVISADPQWRKPCLDHGITHFLVKPVPTQHLLGLLNDILSA